jgi:hypothetical protein
MSMRRSAGASTLIASASSDLPGSVRTGSASFMRGRPSGSASEIVGSSVGHSMCGRIVASSSPSGSLSADTTGLPNCPKVTNTRRPNDVVPTPITPTWPNGDEAFGASSLTAAPASRQ